VCDSHAAVVKRRLKKVALRGERSEGAEAFAKVAAKVKNTLTTVSFAHFSRAEKFESSKITGVKGLHVLWWSGKKRNGNQFEIVGKTTIDDPIEHSVWVTAAYDIDALLMKSGEEIISSNNRKRKKRGDEVRPLRVTKSTIQWEL